jgi:hypothetical protein
MQPPAGTVGGAAVVLAVAQEQPGVLAGVHLGGWGDQCSPEWRSAPPSSETRRDTSREPVLQESPGFFFTGKPRSRGSAWRLHERRSTCSCIFRIEVSIHVPATANTVAPSPTGRCALGRERQLSRPRWCRVAVAELSARGRSRVIRRRGHLQWPHRFGLTAETTHRASRSSPTSRVDGDPSRQTPATLPQRRFESDAEGTCGGSPRPYVPTGVPPFEQTYAGSPNWPTGPGQSIHHQTRPTISHACMPHHPSPTNGCMSPRVQHVEPAIRSRHGPRLAMLFGGGCSHVRGGH